MSHTFRDTKEDTEKQARYFVHDEYAGLSAFINKPDEQSERAARMLAVGVLVPLEHGRMGRSWRHAEAIKDLARYVNKRHASEREDSSSQGANQEHRGYHCTGRILGETQN